jgi:hypothetical protein
MSKFTMNRRAWMKGMGVTAGLAPFFPALETRAEGGAPLRLLLLFSGNGVVRDRFVPTGSVDDWELSETLQPLAPVKEHLVVCEGFKYPTGGTFDGHPAGLSAFAAGSGLADGGPFYGGTVGWGLSKTIDQMYADTLDTPFHSLQMRAGYGHSANIWNTLSYAGPQDPLGGEYDPGKLFDFLFSDAVGGSAALAEIRARRKSVLDVAMADAQRLQTRVSGVDRQRIEGHLDLIRDLEKRLDGGSCDPGSLERTDEPSDYWRQFASMPTQCDTMREMIVSSFACDLTRSISLVLGGGATSQQEYPWLDLVPLGGDTTHHDISHLSHQDGRDNIVKIDQFHMGVVNNIIADLAATPDVDGNSLLYNTLVMWGTDIGEGDNHTWNWLPAMFAGQAGGRLQTNRFLQIDGAPFNRALVSVLHELGFPEIQSIGTQDNGTGPLSGLFS